MKFDDVRVHLFRKGFVSEYYVWNRHGELYESMHSKKSTCHLTRAVDVEPTNPYHKMILDAIGPKFENDFMEEAPNLNAQKFYDMLNAVDEKVWDGCTTHSQMSEVARLLHMKSEHHFSERCYDDFIRFLREVLPDDNKMINNFYRTKKLVQGLGLPVEKIDCCNNNYMIYWGDDSALTSCKFCNHPRFKMKRGSEKHKKKKIHSRGCITFL